MEDLRIFCSNLKTLSLHWLIFGVCIHLRKNYIFSLKWIQIFSIHELSSLWFLNRSSVYHLSYAFTFSITIDSFLCLIIYWVYTYEYVFHIITKDILFVCVFPSNLPLRHCRSPLSQFSFFLSDKSDMAGWLDNRKPFHCSDLFLKENKKASIQDH